MHKTYNKEIKFHRKLFDAAYFFYSIARFLLLFPFSSKYRYIIFLPFVKYKKKKENKNIANSKEKLMKKKHYDMQDFYLLFFLFFPTFYLTKISI